MDTAIIGLGNIGSRLAKNLTAGGESIIVADKTLAKAETLAGDLGRNAKAMLIQEAISKAEIVVLAIYFDAIKEFLVTYRSEVAGKIIVDPSNPIAPDGQGGFTKIIPAHESSGQLISARLPDGAKLVKAFGTLGAESLASGVNRLPDRAVLFYATDFPDAGNVVATLITASGFSPVSVGGIDPGVVGEGSHLHVVAGQVNGIQGPMALSGGAIFARLELDAHARAVLTFGAGPELGLYVLQGEVDVGGTMLTTGMLGVLGSGSDVQIVTVGDGAVEVALIGGDPVRGDVLFSGPFVMDTPERLAQAKRDFAAGRMGRM